ncbi:MAG TPA: hypothetical protein IAD51_02610 [Candidatus Limadaptatus stercorigallinarum]|uniref:Uncharacterized protein n=1 Tax=Candidatus Limadaptatus stercorigallinarum TaxID=2840845 RepID=A0A9D1HR46_9FIRM|nr:hypothetical protein [Candidatus Limadaptatus stercorigallinarum]
MKKKAFLFVIAALVLCLTCGMLLVACDKDDDNNNNNNNNNNTEDVFVDASIDDVFSTVVTKLDAANKANDGEFAFALEVEQTDSEGANSGTLFGLAYEKIGDDYFIYAAAGNDNYVKINAAPLGQIINDVLTLVTANVDGITMKDGYPAFTIFGREISLSPDVIGSLPTLLSSFLGFDLFDYAEESINGDGAYILHINIADILEQLPGVVKTVAGFIDSEAVAGLPNNASLAQTIEALAGLDEGTIDGYVAKYAGDIFEGQQIQTLADLLGYFAEAVDTIDVKLAFMFDTRVADDATNPFTDIVAISSDVRDATNAINVLNLNLDATLAGYTEVTDGDNSITVGGDEKNYEVSVDMNLDLFAAADMLHLVAEAERSQTAVDKPVEPTAPGDDATAEDLAAYEEAMAEYKAALEAYEAYRAAVDKYFDDNFASTMVGILDKVGYLNITVNEVDEVDGEVEVVRNILTFYLNGADGYAVITANVYSTTGNVLAGEDGVIQLGGVYDFEALVDYIIVMMEEGWNGSPETFATGAADPCGVFKHEDANNDGNCDICGNPMPGIMDYVTAVLNMATSNFQMLTDDSGAMTGIRLNVQGIIDAVFENFVSDGKLSIPDEFLANLVGGVQDAGNDQVTFALLGGIEAFDIAVQIPTRVYGAVSTPAAGSYAGEKLACGIAAGEGAAVSYDANAYYANGFVLEGKYTVTYIDGTTATLSANDLRLVWVDADSNAPGTEVTAYVTVANETLKNMIAESDEIGHDTTNYYHNKVAYPLSGLFEITLKVA